MAVTGTHKLPMAKKLARAVRLGEHGMRVWLVLVLEGHWATTLNLKMEVWNPDESYLHAAIAFACPFGALY